jgi:hypothetical protein
LSSRRRIGLRRRGPLFMRETALILGQWRYSVRGFRLDRRITS